MENVNTYIKYVYIPIIVIIFVLLIILFIRLVKLMRKAAGIKDGVKTIKKKTDTANAKIEEIKKSKKAFKFFLSIYIIFKVLKETIKDYRQTKHGDRNLTKSFSKTCKANIASIKKIKL